jgi:hypothetical protein
MTADKYLFGARHDQDPEPPTTAAGCVSAIDLHAWGPDATVDEANIGANATVAFELSDRVTTIDINSPLGNRRLLARTDQLLEALHTGGVI